MKIKHLFFVLFVTAAVLGCGGAPKTKPDTDAGAGGSPPPEVKIVEKEVPVYITPDVAITPAILDRLTKMPDFIDIKNYQFVLNGQIILNITDIRPNDRTIVPDGSAIFENVLLRNTVTFPNKCLGVALGDAIQEGDDLVLRVCFERREDEAKYPAETHNLRFSARKTDENAYFRLVYEERPDMLSEEKGRMEYGGTRYPILFTGERPYLMMRLDQKTKDAVENRSVGGRTIR